MVFKTKWIAYVIMAVMHEKTEVGKLAFLTSDLSVGVMKYVMTL
jgi:hypothetical protein